jgi:hypothetical protein
LRFTFTIGSLPIKFYRGEADDIPGNCLVRSYAELRQMQLAFQVEGIQATHILRLAVETDAYGNMGSISLVEVDEAGSPARLYEIPLDAEKVVLMRSKPINLAPPVLEVIEETSEDSKRGETGDKRGASGAGN